MCVCVNAGVYTLQNTKDLSQQTPKYLLDICSRTILMCSLREKQWKCFHKQWPVEKTSFALYMCVCVVRSLNLSLVLCDVCLSVCNSHTCSSTHCVPSGSCWLCTGTAGGVRGQPWSRQQQVNWPPPLYVEHLACIMCLLCRFMTCV